MKRRVVKGAGTTAWKLHFHDFSAGSTAPPQRKYSVWSRSSTLVSMSTFHAIVGPSSRNRMRSSNVLRRVDAGCSWWLEVHQAPAAWQAPRVLRCCVFRVSRCHTCMFERFVRFVEVENFQAGRGSTRFSSRTLSRLLDVGLSLTKIRQPESLQDNGKASSIVTPRRACCTPLGAVPPAWRPPLSWRGCR